MKNEVIKIKSETGDISEITDAIAYFLRLCQIRHTEVNLSPNGQFWEVWNDANIVMFLKVVIEKPVNQLSPSERLQNFYNEVSDPNSPMPKYTLNQIAFALNHASEPQIEQFLDWLYDGSEYPDPISLAYLNQGKFNYRENFGQIPVLSYRYKAPYLKKNPDAGNYLTGDQNTDRLEEKLEKIVNEHKPYGLDWNNVYSEVSVKKMSGTVYTAFDAEDFSPKREEIIAEVEFY